MRKTAPDCWIARCPAHEDREPSLSIRELDDGTVLLRCYAGCSAVAVVHAIGLELHDLFPPRPAAHHHGPVPRSQRPYLTMSEMITLLRHSVTVVAIAAEDLSTGKPLSPEDLEAMRTAAERLHSVLEMADV